MTAVRCVLAGLLFGATVDTLTQHRVLLWIAAAGIVGLYAAAVVGAVREREARR